MRRNYLVTTPLVRFATAKMTFVPLPKSSDPIRIEYYDVPALEVAVVAEDEEEAKEQALIKLVATHRLTPMDVDLIRKHSREIDWIVQESWYKLDW